MHKLFIPLALGASVLITPTVSAVPNSTPISCVSTPVAINTQAALPSAVQTTIAEAQRTHTPVPHSNNPAPMPPAR